MSDLLGGRQDAGDFTIMLPGTWMIIPMSTKEDISARVARAVKQRVPKGDRFAALRMQARRELEASTLEAFNSGATFYALAMEIVPGFPFSASLIGMRAGWPDEAAGKADPAERVKAALPNGVDLEHPSGALRRRISHVVQRPGEVDITSLDIEYWLARGDQPPAVFMVSVPTAPASDDEVIEFFDAVIGTTLWNDEQRYVEVDEPVIEVGSPLHSADE